MLEKQIKDKITNNIQCSFLKIINESALHAGHQHFENTEESHYRIIISSDEFNNQKTLNIHKRIYNILKEEMNKIHALAIEVK